MAKVIVAPFKKRPTSNKERKALAALSDKSHGGYIEEVESFINVCDSDIFDGEKTVRLDGEFCAAELRALLILMAC